MKKFFRLQHRNISIEKMRSFTSDYSNDGDDGDEGTICASTSPWEKSWGGARDAYRPGEGEVIVLTGQVARRIYDGVRLYSDTLKEIARFPLEEWEEMQRMESEILQDFDS